MLCMIFGQLTARDSMRELMLSLEAHKSKYYHLGFGATVSRTNLGKANRNRDYRIYEEFAYTLIAEARNSYNKNDFEVKVDGNVYAFDSSTIDLCLNVFWWAEFRKHKGGIKLHTLYDVKTSIPTIVLVTNAKVHDVNMLDELSYEKGSFYIMDKGYVDFTRLHKLHTCGAYFVTRAKDNMRFRRMYFPQSRQKTASQNLSRWIQGCPELWEGLRRMGYEKTRKYYLKPEVELIVKCLGEP